MTENEQVAQASAGADTENAEEVPFRDPESAEMELKISKDIMGMPDEVKDRFKAIKVLTDKMHQLDEEEDLAYRALERKYELLYQQVYERRAALLKGDVEPDAETVAKFEEVKQGLMDEDYDKLEVEICDVKDIQNTVKGVSGFWLRAMLAHSNLQREITEKDRPILAYLQDIRLALHEKGFGYTLTFVFEPNQYFAGNELTKTFVMSKPQVLEKCVGTPIEWAAGSDPTHEKKKKKVKKQGKAKTVTTTVKVDSFFNFFDTVEAKDLDKPEGDEDDDEESDPGEQMDHDMDVGNDIKDDIVPLALEYYLGVIEKDDDDADEDGDDDDDDDDEDAPKPKSKKAGGKGPAGKGGEECKQQ